MRSWLLDWTKGQLFAPEMFGFADFAADLACAPFHRPLSFHPAVADHPTGLLLDVTLEFSCASARSISATRFHNQTISGPQRLVATGVKGVAQEASAV